MFDFEEPQRRERIGELLVEEIYWNGRFPCYVNNRLSADNYEKTIDKIKRGEPVAYK